MALTEDDDTGVYDFVPSDAGEIGAIIVTKAERDLLAKLLVMRALTSEADKPLALALKDKLPRIVDAT